MRISIPLDLSSRPFIPLPRFIRRRHPLPLLVPSLVLTPRCSTTYAEHEGFSYLIVLSVFLTPYSFSVTFFTRFPSPFFILMQINETRGDSKDPDISSRVRGNTSKEELSSCFNSQNPGPDNPCYEKVSQWFPVDVFSKLSPLSLVIPRPGHKVVFTRFHRPTSNDIRFFTLCSPDPSTHHTHQPTTNSRKEQVWEVFLTYDTVHWIPTTGSLQVQGLPQSTTPIPNSFNSWYKTVLSIQDLPYPGFSRYGFHFRCL
jgi:hypothetical protein